MGKIKAWRGVFAEMSVEIHDNSKEVSEDIKAALLRGLETCGLVAEGYAKKLAPVGTPESTGIPGYIGGLLRGSITHALSGNKPAISTYQDNAGTRRGSYSGTAPEESGANKSAVYIGTNVEYSSYVELGTIKMDAKPFLKPAVADHANEYRKIIEKELKNG